MLKSILSRSAFIYFVSGLISASCNLPVAAQEFIDDAAIKKAIESGLKSLQDTGTTPGAVDLLKELRSEPLFQGKFPKRNKLSNLSESEILRSAEESTVVIGNLYLCGKCDDWHTSTAGGVIISEDGLLLTNYHVLEAEKASVFAVMTSDQKVYSIEKVLAASKLNDVALVKLEGASGLTPAPFAEGGNKGDEVFVISHPDSHFYTHTSGRISRFALSTKHKVPLLQVTADFARGSSGAGVFDAHGRLLGLVASTSSIYYDQDKNTQKDLQMVFKSCVPLRSILELFEQPMSPK
tara:strand:+ start:2265 stop:3146 length:882 start_codon:yes stop_codon:yes gene_type:complete